MPAAEAERGLSTAAILRALRVALHVGFALLLGVSVMRLLASAGDETRSYLLLGVALLLAGAYLAGTIVEKRFAADSNRPDPRRYGVLWLGLITALWAVLLIGSADFAWLAFPFFFLHLHLLPRRVALVTIAAMTAAVILALWTASGASEPSLALILGPVLGAAFSVVTGLAYQGLYREAEQQRRAADELRRTRAKLAESQHRAGVLAERERLAREIHDTLAQGFSSIVLMARAAERSLLGGDTGTAAERLATVQRTAAENLGEARSFVRGLASPQLQQAPLAESLRKLCAETETSAAAQGLELRCRFQLDGEAAELSQTHQITLFRAAQASLANISEHAGTSTAVVTLAFLESEVTLDIYDDGRGFDLNQLPGLEQRSDGSGFGIRSLQERVAALQGSLDLESAPGEGTVVGISLPLTAAQEGTPQHE
ncbi:sensor histidine kinase [Acaricomes phytoseiuli]|uniref:sensor histidine kinase n=1 Tax=Acaricomes phytoseiuli TaxID=291968 RepID=UPI0022233C61|nr:sensor histidine kinase [Acaricomes phytoseiuli]MCW1249298.1 sensor histidine kinase [Acaricomes phytoseiuli]